MSEPASTWEQRMSERAQARMASEREKDLARADPQYVPNPFPDIPTTLAADLPEGAEDVARHWCTSCGLADPPMDADKWSPTPPCTRCGSLWRWYGRIADRDGTATQPPLGVGECLDCYEWRRFPGGQEHFGWGWWRICGSTRCGHEHHDGEIWLA